MGEIPKDEPHVDPHAGDAPANRPVENTDPGPEAGADSPPGGPPPDGPPPQGDESRPYAGDAVDADLLHRDLASQDVSSITDHAWDKHGAEFEEIGITSREGMEDHVEHVIQTGERLDQDKVRETMGENFANETPASGDATRTMYWDAESSTVVIRNNHQADGAGTAFRHDLDGSPLKTENVLDGRGRGQDTSDGVRLGGLGPRRESDGPPSGHTSTRPSDLR